METKSSTYYLNACINKHGSRYDYSKSEMKRRKDKITIICREHGEFIQSICAHLQGKGCPYCSGNKSTRKGKFIDNEDGTISIPLTQGKFAIADKRNAIKLAKYNWCYLKTSNREYAVCNLITNGKIKTFYMHRCILSESDSQIHIDHINGNGLDNREINIRKCTISQNMRNKGLQSNNTTGFKGVSMTKYGKFRAQIIFDNERFYLGQYETPILAAKAYDDAAKKYFGEFAQLNIK